MAGATPEVDILAIGAVIVAAMAAAEVIDRLSGEGFRGETGPGDDDLAVFVLISGVCGLKSGHFLYSQAKSVFGEPAGKFFLAEAALGEIEKSEISVLFRGRDVPAISIQKGDGNYERHALVAVDERMISSDAEGIGSRQSKDIRVVRVVKDIQRLCEVGIKQRFVSNAVRAAMLCKLLAVYG
jgi:hypothetical protein